MYIRRRVQPWSNTFVSVGHVRINYSSFWHTSRFTGQLDLSGIIMKVRERVLGHSLEPLKEVNKYI
jgi:hypothetical protein